MVAAWHVATATAVGELFALAYPGADLVQQRGCSAQFDPEYCVYRVGDNLLSLTVSQQGAGWVVSGATLESAGG
jgi:hypothetical protein